MPSCFMIMPYGRKATQAEPGRGPAEIDFNCAVGSRLRPGYQGARAMSRCARTRTPAH